MFIQFIIYLMKINKYKNLKTSGKLISMPLDRFRRNHLRSISGIIWSSGSFAVQSGDHLRRCTVPPKLVLSTQYKDIWVGGRWFPNLASCAREKKSILYWSRVVWCSPSASSWRTIGRPVLHLPKRLDYLKLVQEVANKTFGHYSPCSL